jgi:hypothetical protein
VWGGRGRSLLAAQHFRDRLLQRIEPDTRIRRRVPRGRRSKTGVVGVSVERHVVEGRVYERYVACWPDPEMGVQRRRFLVERYGRERALALAIEARVSGVELTHARQLARQREEARGRLEKAAPLPRPVKDPRSRKGISMARWGRGRRPSSASRSKDAFSSGRPSGLRPSASTLP